MKKLILGAILAWSVFSASAAETWLTDLAKAKEQAKKENKAILVNFTGSDWCGFCIKLKKEVFNTKEFEEFASKNLVLVEVDFPNKKKLPQSQASENNKLKDQYKIEGYPTIVLLDNTGKKLGEEVGYGGGGPSKYISKLKTMLPKKSS